MLNSIIVIGSSNTDMVIKTSKFPKPGETLLGGEFLMTEGGKGANQAVAAARLGGNVTLICKLGNDIFGSRTSKLLESEGINTSYILVDEKAPSGVALITVDQSGENTIVVASGANGTFYPADLQQALKEIENAGIIMMQLEIPMETVLFIARYAKLKGSKFILDPAPASELTDELLNLVDIITPNQTETEILCGVKVQDLDSAKVAAKLIYLRGAKSVVITMGAIGAVICEGGVLDFVAGEPVDAIDTTAAGDVFNGGLAVALSEGKKLKEAVKFACAAAAISVKRQGAQSSIPYRNELVM